MDPRAPHAEPSRPSGLAVFVMRWRVLLYLLLLLAALVIARAGIEARRHAPAPPNVESDD